MGCRALGSRDGDPHNEGKPLEASYRPHTLSGQYKLHWECHVEPDFLLIRQYAPDDEIVFVRTGTHADLF